MHGFIAADVADFQTEWLFIAGDSPIPEFFGFYTVADNVAEFVYLDFAVGVPNVIGRSTVNREKFNQFQTGIADGDWSKLFLFTCVGKTFFVIGVDLVIYPVAGKLFDLNAISCE